MREVKVLSKSEGVCQLQRLPYRCLREDVIVGQILSNCQLSPIIPLLAQTTQSREAALEKAAILTLVSRYYFGANSCDTGRACKIQL